MSYTHNFLIPVCTHAQSAFISSSYYILYNRINDIKKIHPEETIIIKIWELIKSEFYLFKWFKPSNKGPFLDL